ncbi:MAG: 1-acyl-sn-glycerol-3-phosphate acyltransferase [Candidatus Amulumruptor caecigallinarius]|nr:1-acyl-sn-glycerol-3-phosphate acyltransferase [Candidatus Amulumruptor caecigallinarius]MCM1396080.1 1-acyl-sn-glycerol-3-phosphate acyltransferase [Candidatus Amulumruptor caecigallinarius]MCM1453911.1 1-acyl-sn-glycerol-3-phosphate acyltransferase [bacterium]
MKIDIDAVIRERLPRYYRYIPRPLIAWLEHEVCQRDLNSLLGHAEGLEGADFCRDVLAYLHVDYAVHGADSLPAAADRRVTYVSNHPLGGLDGMALIDMVTRHHGVEPYFVVNDLLMAVEPLRKVFVPVNKLGRQSRGATTMVEEAFASERPMIVFPAGLVSRRGKGGKVADLRWRKSFVNLSVSSGRDIVPLYFDGENSRLFYRLAQARERLGLKFNYEMLRLPREVMLSRGKHFDIYVGRRIPVTRLHGGARAVDESLAIRKIVYSLKLGPAE